jgi:hypothetical protein
MILKITITAIGVAVLAILNSQVTEGQIFYDGVNSCPSDPAVKCPFGTQDYGGPNCIRPNSEFCRIATGSGAITEKGEREQYCALEPLPTFGRCSGNEFIPNSSSTDWKDLRDRILAIVRNSNDWYEDTGKSGQLRCEEKDDKDLVHIPRIEHDNVSQNDDPYSNEENIEHTYEAARLGLIVVQDYEGKTKSSEENYCSSTSEVYIRADGAERGDGRCYPTIGSRPCRVENVRGLGDLCIIGLRPTTPPQTYVYRHSAEKDDPFLRNVVYTTDMALCQNTAKDKLESSSNKGCSDYTTIDRANNRVVASDVDRYYECVRCLYGGETFSEAYANNPNGAGPREVGSVKDASGNDFDPPGPRDRITPETEYFAIQLQGRFYSDLGCIDTSDSESVINTVLRIALGLMALLVVARIIQGAIMMQQVMESDPEALQVGKDIITSALLALFLLIFSAALLNFIGINVLQIQGFPEII